MTSNFIKNEFKGQLVWNGGGGVNTYSPTFNPLDKLIQVMDENKRLHEELLKSEREKVKMLEKLLHRKQ